MRSRNILHLVSCHAEGEVGNVIVGGVAPPPGDSLWQQAQWIARDQNLRRFVLNEPRGGVFKHVNLLVPARDESAAWGLPFTKQDLGLWNHLGPALNRLPRGVKSSTMWVVSQA